MTTLTPNKCLRPMDVNCFIVFALFVFFSFALLTLGHQLLISREEIASLLFKVDRLEHDGFGIIWPTTSWTTRICSEEFVITELTNLVVSSALLRTVTTSLPGDHIGMGGNSSRIDLEVLRRVDNLGRPIYQHSLLVNHTLHSHLLQVPATESSYQTSILLERITQIAFV